MKRIVCIAATLAIATSASAADRLTDLRRQIDSLDNKLIEVLAKRMEVCREVGQYKKQKGMAVVQSDRFNEILEKRSRQGADSGLDSNFVKQMMTLIHDESVRQQNELTGK